MNYWLHAQVNKYDYYIFCTCQETCPPVKTWSKYRIFDMYTSGNQQLNSSISCQLPSMFFKEMFW